MKKRTRLKKKRLAPPLVKPTEKPLPRTQIESLQRAFSRLFVLSLLVNIIWKSDIVYNWSGSKNSRSEFNLKSLLVVTILYPAVILVLLAITKFKRIDDLPYEAALKAIKRAVVFYSLMVVIVLVLSLHATGVIGKLSSLIFRVFPSIGEKTSNILSTILGWIASGVVGNFVYDIMKRKYLQIKSNSSN